MTGGSVPHFLFAPTRETSLRALSVALIKVRSLDGMTIPKLMDALGYKDPGAIQDATNEVSLLSFDKVARLVFLFPDQCASLQELWNRPRTEMTAEDHKAAIEHHTAELLRMTREVRA